MMKNMPLLKSKQMNQSQNLIKQNHTIPEVFLINNICKVKILIDWVCLTRSLQTKF